MAAMKQRVIEKSYKQEKNRHADYFKVKRLLDIGLKGFCAYR